MKKVFARFGIVLGIVFGMLGAGTAANAVGVMPPVPRYNTAVPAPTAQAPLTVVTVKKYLPGHCLGVNESTRACQQLVQQILKGQRFVFETRRATPPTTKPTPPNKGIINPLPAAR